MEIFHIDGRNPLGFRCLQNKCLKFWRGVQRGNQQKVGQVLIRNGLCYFRNSRDKVNIPNFLHLFRDFDPIQRLDKGRSERANYWLKRLFRKVSGQMMFKHQVPFTWLDSSPCEWYHGGSENGVIKEILQRLPSLEVLAVLQSRDLACLSLHHQSLRWGMSPYPEKVYVMNEWISQKISPPPLSTRRAQRDSDEHSIRNSVCSPVFISGSLAGKIQEELRGDPVRHCY